MAQGVKEKIRIVTGIEFSTQWQGRGIHLVGLNFDAENKNIGELITLQSAARERRAELIADKLETKGIIGSLAGAKQFCQAGASLGRPHFAQFLVAQGHARSIKQAFQRYLGAGKVCDIKQEWPEFAPVVEAIKAAGGSPVLAHPAKYVMTRTKLCAMVADFKASGGEGIELLSGKQTQDKTRAMTQIAANFGLKGSCGSDFHAPGQAWQELGRFGPLPANIVPIWADWD